MMWNSFVCVVFVLMALACLVSGDSVPAVHSGIEQLLSKDYKTVMAAKEEILAERKALVQSLIDILESEEYEPGKDFALQAAMEILGEMRAVEAVPLLAANIGFPHVLASGVEPVAGMTVLQVYMFGNTPLERMPAVHALVKIGEPAIPKVLAKLAQTGDSTESKHCLRVLLELKGTEGTAALLGKSIVREPDRQKRRRLQSALSFLSCISTTRLEDTLPTPGR